MNFLVNLIVKHVQAAVLANWKTTVCGLIVAAIGVLQAAVPMIQGHSIDQVDWAAIGSKLVTALGLVLAKDFSLTSIIFSAPRAEPVEEKK